MPTPLRQLVANHPKQLALMLKHLFIYLSIYVLKGQARYTRFIRFKDIAFDLYSSNENYKRSTRLFICYAQPDFSYLRAIFFKMLYLYSTVGGQYFEHLIILGFRISIIVTQSRPEIDLF